MTTSGDDRRRAVAEAKRRDFMGARSRIAEVLSWLLAAVALAATLAGILALAMMVGCGGAPVRPVEVSGSGTVSLTLDTPVGPLVVYVEAGGGVPVDGGEPTGEALVCWRLGKGQPQCAVIAESGLPR